MNAPERIINVLAHGGWSVSVMSIVNMVKALTKEQKSILRGLSTDGLCAIAYDNLDFDFKVKELTLENPGGFASITTGTFLPLSPEMTPSSLQFSKELWEKSSLNPHGTKDSMPPSIPTPRYIMGQIIEAHPHIKLAMLWFIKDILIKNYLPDEYKDLLGPVPSSKWIPIRKTVQHPAHAMHIKASSTDGNVEIVENMEHQLGTADQWYDSHVHLCHGDLGTQECHDTTMSFHSIEKSRKNRLQWLIPIPGVFHIRMAAVDAIWRMHIRDKNMQENSGGTFKLFHTLCPKDSLKLTTNPGYHMLNDGFQHLIKTHLLVCWEHVTGLSDLTAFAKTKPKWDDIEGKAREILHKYVAGQNFQALQDQPDSNRDCKRENQLLFN